MTAPPTITEGSRRHQETVDEDDAPSTNPRLDGLTLNRTGTKQITDRSALSLSLALRPVEPLPATVPARPRKRRGRSSDSP